MINVLQDYFNEAFSSPYLKKLIILTHPHRKHLTGEYILDIKDLIYSAKSQSNYNEKIKIISFYKDIKNLPTKELDRIFINNDAYSHLKENYFLTYVLPKVLDEIN